MALIGLNYSSEIPRSLILDLLLTACFFLEFLHTFAFKRLGQMHPLERPLWYSDSPIPTFYILVLALLFWPVLISTFVWGLLHFPGGGSSLSAWLGPL